MFIETKILFQETKVFFRKRNFCFGKAKSFLSNLNEFFRQRKELIPFDMQNFVYVVKIFTMTSKKTITSSN